MALFRPRFQILSFSIPHTKVLTDNIKCTSSLERKLLSLGEKSIWSWYKKKNNKEDSKSCPPSNVFHENPCRRRLPQCPEHICTGKPSKCLEEGYGKPIKVKRSWLSLSSPPVQIKEKPSNCDPPTCEKEITFREYIFGPDEPLPNPRTCRMAWKIHQMCNEIDPRLDDTRYKTTEGDVLVYSESEKLKKLPPPEPQVKAPTPYKEPASVICKRIADSVAATVTCFCACVPDREETICQNNLCPVHMKPFRFPYDEMKPKNPKKKFFTCETGILSEDVALPPRRQSCSCVTQVFAEKTKFPPSHEHCEFHKVLKQRGELIERNQFIKGSDRKMSRCEKLRLITTLKNSEEDLPMIIKTKVSCESKCGCKSGI